MQVTTRSINYSMTNMVNAHTCAICSVNLVIAVVLVMDAELLKITGNVISGTCVHVPVGVDAVGVHGGVDMVLVRDIVGVELVPALLCRAAFFVADLASAREPTLPIFVVVVGAVAATTATIAAAAAPVAVATVGVATSRCNIDRGLIALMKKVQALLEAKDLHLKLGEEDRLDVCDDGRHERVVVGAKTSENIGVELLIP